MISVSKRQILDVCNRLFQTEKSKYIKSSKKGNQFLATVMANDLIFQLAIETADYEMVLRGVHDWWSESTYNPEGKKFKS